MAFVQFEGEIGVRGKTSTPTAAINSKDEIHFNRGAVELLEMQELELVTLHWDEDKEIIGLLPCAEDAPYAVPVRHVPKNGMARVPGRSFFNFFKMAEAYTNSRVAPVKDAKTGMILIKLGKE